jgi:hypothetical protein
VSMPFDFHNDDHPEGLASARVRMMQPYAGKGRGMQFPMAKGTEVLLTFVDGDPDRPLIAGAINTAAAPGPVTADNQTESVIQSGGNNRIRMEDKHGSERVMLESPAANSWLRIGVPNDPVSLNGSATVNILEGEVYIEQGAYSTSAGARTPITAPWKTAEAANLATGVTINTGLAGSKYTLTYRSPKTTGGGFDTAIRTVNIISGVNDIDPGPGIRVQTSGSLYLEAQSQFAIYAKGSPSIGALPFKAVATGAKPNDVSPNQVGNLYSKFVDKLDDNGAKSISGKIPYNPTNIKTYDPDPTTGKPADLPNFQSVLPNAHLTLSSLDTVNTQEGNIYDFGGYWNYNLGNSYAEDHIRQDAVLNTSHTVPFPKEGVSFNVDALASQVPLLVTGAVGVVVGSIAGVAAGGKGGVAIAALGSACWTAIAFVIATGVSAAAQGISIAVTGAKTLDDLVTSPGGTAPISTWADAVKASKIEETGTAPNVVSKLVQLDTAMVPGKTWVSKTFGDAYSFNQGNSIEISEGNSESHTTGDTHEYVYGGDHEETKFNGKGIRTSWSKSGGGQGQEMTCNPLDGAFTKWTYTDTRAMLFSIELALATLPKTDVSVSLSSLQTTFKASAGANVDFEISAGLSTSMKASIGFAFEVEAAAAWKLKINPDDGVEFSGPGTKANKEAEFKASVMSAIVEDAKMVVTNEKVRTSSRGADVGDAKLAFRSGQWIYA